MRTAERCAEIVLWPCKSAQRNRPVGELPDGEEPCGGVVGRFEFMTARLRLAEGGEGLKKLGKDFWKPLREELENRKKRKEVSK